MDAIVETGFGRTERVVHFACGPREGCLGEETFYRFTSNKKMSTSQAAGTMQIMPIPGSTRNLVPSF